MEKEKKQYIDVELVKTLMKSKNIDEKEMAKRMNVTLPTIRKFLSGADQSRMSTTMLIKIMLALDTSAESLLHKEYQTKPNRRRQC